jgi:hypothetical protein
MSEDVCADSKVVLNYCPLFSVYGLNDVMQSEVCTDSLTSEYIRSSFEVETN